MDEISICQIGLVGYRYIKQAGCFQVFYLRLYFFGLVAGGIEQADDDVCLLHGFAAAGDALLLYGVGGMIADAGGVYKPEQDTVYVECFFYGVAGGTGYLAHNGALFVEQGIEQSAFACIGLADNGYFDAVANDVAELERIYQLPGGSGHSGDEFVKAGAVGKLNIFLAEVKLQLYECAEHDELLAHGFEVGTEAAAQVVYRGAVGIVALAGDEVGYGFCLCQVQPAI